MTDDQISQKLKGTELERQGVKAIGVDKIIWQFVESKGLTNRGAPITDELKGRADLVLVEHASKGTPIDLGEYAQQLGIQPEAVLKPAPVDPNAPPCESRRCQGSRTPSRVEMMGLYQITRLVSCQPIV